MVNKELPLLSRSIMNLLSLSPDEKLSEYFLSGYPYIIQSLTCFALGLLVGWYLVNSLVKAGEDRINSKQSIFLLSVLLFVSPIIGYIILFILSMNQVLQKHLCDFFTLGIVMSILYNYTYFPKQKLMTKLLVEEMSGKHAELWLESIDIPIRELQIKIATAMNIFPPSRVEIESGKGAILDDLNRSFQSIIDENSITIDPLDGHMILTCYVTLTDEIIELDELTTLGSPRHNVPFYHNLLTNRVDVKYSSDTYYLTAKIPFASSDAKAFNICPIEKFAAASPLSSHMSVKVIPWKAEDDAKSSISDNGDDAKSGNGIGPPRLQKQNSPPKPFWKKKLHLPSMKRAPSQQVHNGDIVVLECESKYMSVTRGWWLSWSSPTPRRSGAFIIEIIERAPQNKIMETFNKIRRPSIITSGPSMITQTNLASASSSSYTTTTGNSSPPPNNSYMMTNNPLVPNSTVSNSISGQGQNDDVLYTGDTFRLRSIKFPDYEFGITNNRINDDHCYTGLRKIGSNSSSGDDWCIGVHFTFKPHSLGSQLIKTAIPFNQDRSSSS